VFAPRSPPEVSGVDLRLEPGCLDFTKPVFRVTVRAAVEIAKADLSVAEANRVLAANQVDVAAATVERIKALLSYRQIVAPFDGVVARRLVNRGDLVQVATTATRTTPALGRWSCGPRGRTIARALEWRAANAMTH
jgi:hypothetical protein